MLKLLSLIGTLGVSTSAVAPVIMLEQNINDNISIRVEAGIMRVNVNNSKHFDKDGKIIVGTYDYKEVLIKAIEEQRAFNKSNNVTNFVIKNSIVRLPGISFDGTIRVGRTLTEVINAKNYEILNMNVTVDKLDNWGNYTYAISYEAIADGKMIGENLYGYQRLQSLADFQIKPGYNMIFETEYNISESIEHTDTLFNSNIYLPDLGINFLSEQIIDMFNSEKNTLNDQAIKYINSTLKVKLNVVESLNVYKAVSNNNDSFSIGEAYSNQEYVKDQYFYVSFSSKDAIGTFNMLVSNNKK
ncbi:hypothetical protein [Spiroplasma floricola]|uniref:Uncharacterized protein n=1 Tax=Spiroplasma floricola 23-6 TaxID=1336749 RepID=A0A2K8SCL2_9MOLU|nr:hypothetical protein [Spiroplasma floricola]AUB31199.1 hypothetical protein SFLOR_v1c01380 [Spiroplasma floricola 23-6]